MHPPDQPKHVTVRAFVGVFGPGATHPRAIGNCCGRAADNISVGSAHVAYVARHDDSKPANATASSVVLRTGRPFFEDRLLEAGPIPAPDELDGKFAYLHLTSDGVELVTDFMGAGTIYHASQDGSLYFASHLGLLLQALPSAPALNDLGVAAQLFTRAQIFDETHFSGAYRLGPCGRLRGRLDGDGKVQFDIDHGRGLMGLLEMKAPRLTLDAFGDMLDTSIERERYDADSVLMLSGGRDSCAIALSGAPTPKRAVTYGEPYSIDLQRGRLRARRLGLDFLAVPYQAWNLETFLEETAGLLAGCAGLQTAHNIVGYDWAADKAALAATGFLGDVYRERYLRRVDGVVDEPDLRNWMAKNENDPILKEVFPKEWDIIISYTMDAFSDLRHEVGAHKALTILKLRWQETRWLSLTFDLGDWFVPVSCPFVNRTMIASWIQSDLEDVKGRDVFDPTIERALAKRGLARNYKGSYVDRARERLAATFQAWRKGRHVVKLCDWPAVYGRSPLPPESSRNVDHPIAEVTTRCWERMTSGKDPGPLPVALLAAPIASAYARLGSR